MDSVAGCVEFSVRQNSVDPGKVLHGISLREGVVREGREGGCAFFGGELNVGSRWEVKLSVFYFLEEYVMIGGM